MGRIARGWSLTKASFNVLKLDKEILVLPILSFLLMVVFMAAWFGVGWFTIGLPEGEGQGGPLHWLWAFTLYVVFAFVGTFFLAATVEMAHIRLEGGDPVVRDGLSKAWSKRGKILQWAIIAAIVGVLLRALRERAGSFAGRIFASVLEVGWAVATYFVVPILIYKDKGPMDAVRGSVDLVKRTWGEAATGVASAGIIFFLLGILGIVPVFLGAAAGPTAALVGVAVAVVYWAVLAAAYSAVRGILVAALYRYAETGTMPEGFEAAAR